ncbi:hypothetical protein PanWU01x14_276180 [Parasponia andersonii]|uniref:Uncharacterized protein n=1 Tax=Parasponia andersonii TaxID=3476 RepID=A0A2P5B2W2_PARAD|nr:hypothetical protein PanWU01x14_276180 [Parasponia andersonii]
MNSSAFLSTSGPPSPTLLGKGEEAASSSFFALCFGLSTTSFWVKRPPISSSSLSVSTSSDSISIFSTKSSSSSFSGSSLKTCLFCLRAKPSWLIMLSSALTVRTDLPSDEPSKRLFFKSFGSLVVVTLLLSSLSREIPSLGKLLVLLELGLNDGGGGGGGGAGGENDLSYSVFFFTMSSEILAWASDTFFPEDKDGDGDSFGEEEDELGRPEREDCDLGARDSTRLNSGSAIEAPLSTSSFISNLPDLDRHGIGEGRTTLSFNFSSTFSQPKPPNSRFEPLENLLEPVFESDRETAEPETTPFSGSGIRDFKLRTGKSNGLSLSPVLDPVPPFLSRTELSWAKTTTGGSFL